MYDRERWNAIFEQIDDGSARALHHKDALRSHWNDEAVVEPSDADAVEKPDSQGEKEQAGI